jgi:hypothetical protein
LTCVKRLDPQRAQLALVGHSGRSGDQTMRASVQIRYALVILTLLGQAGEARAWRNDVLIRVAESRLNQCGAGWDPEGSGRWGNPRGSIEVDGQRIHAYDLSDTAECSKQITHSVQASDGQLIVVKVLTDNGPMQTTLRAVAADRVWQVQYFVDQLWGEVRSTDWPAAAGTATEEDPPATSASALQLRPGQRWRVIETHGTERWIARWQVRDDGVSFDASWRHEPGGEEGTLTEFARLDPVIGNSVVIQRPGLGTYTGTLSADRRHISGRTSWCDCTWTVEMKD